MQVTGDLLRLCYLNQGNSSQKQEQNQAGAKETSGGFQAKALQNVPHLVLDLLCP